MVFLVAPGANFDLASLSFQVPIRGLAAKVAAVAVNTASVTSVVVRFFLTARFERFLRKTSIQTEGIIIEFRTVPRYETGNVVNGKNDIEHVAIEGMKLSGKAT
jgi:hypothetical protein